MASYHSGGGVKLCGLAYRCCVRQVGVKVAKSAAESVPLRSTPPRIPLHSRLPVELSSCLESMMPLHSAIASARHLNAFMTASTQRVIKGHVIQ